MWEVRRTWEIIRMSVYRVIERAFKLGLDRWVRWMVLNEIRLMSLTGIFLFRKWKGLKYKWANSLGRTKVNVRKCSLPSLLPRFYNCFFNLRKLMAYYDPHIRLRARDCEACCCCFFSSCCWMWFLPVKVVESHGVSWVTTPVSCRPS